MRDFVDLNNDKVLSLEDKSWLERVEVNTKLLPNSHYEIQLPIKNKAILPNNKQQAMNYFLSTSKKFSNKEYFNEYDKFMQNMIDNNYMELVPEEDLNPKIGKTWYLVHHGVRHKRKGKLRIVFNCSLKYKGISLNDNLLQGPDLINSLIGVLARFRQKSIAVTADIQKMYYQVQVPIEQSDYLRLFWYDHSKINVVEYRMRVHLFGATSSPSIANFALKRTASDFTDDQSVKNVINKNFYVDDLLLSCSSEDEAVDLLKRVKSTVSQGGFNLTCVSSNSHKVLNSVPKSHLSHNSNNILTPSKEVIDTALGVTWNKETDELSFSVDINFVQNVTKREVLKNVASIFDPIGLCTPVLIPGKKLFQETCRLRLGWDDTLPTKIQDSWRSWVDDVNNLHNFKVKRSLNFSDNIKYSQLHVFVDGSETAYGAVAYVKNIKKNDSIEVGLLSSKSRLTPLNNSTLKTIPRIELCSAKLGVEMAQNLIKELDVKFDKISYWSDSSIVLSYIKSETLRFHRFVDNKVCFIRNFSNCDDWHYVPSENNPADLISRGASVLGLIESKLWISGPPFLVNGELEPEQFAKDTPINNEDCEIKHKATALSTKLNKPNLNPTETFLQSTSSWHKLKIKVAWMLKFKNWLKNKCSDNKKVSCKDLNDAEIAIFSYLQHEEFSSEFNCIKNGKNLPKNSRLRKLNPFIDNNLLRVGGRLQNSNLDFETKHPIILSDKSYPVKLFLNNVHRSVGHLGRESILSHIRRKHWLLRGGSVARKIVNDCIICRKIQGKTSRQLMSELPCNR